MTQTEHWKERAKDPCFPHLREDRKRFLKGIHKSAHLDRMSFLVEAVRGKRVLDIGCVENDADHHTREEWLHNHIVKASAECLGLDILESEVDSLKTKGYNVRYHDITQSPVEGTFDVAVCGEIVEHIGNIDGLLSNCRKSLVPGGQLIMSTPYPWFIGVTARHTLAGIYFPGSLEHVAWYDPSNIAELANRHGYLFEMFAGVNPLPLPGSLKRRAFEWFAKQIRYNRVPVLDPLTGCRSLLYVLKSKG